jgi:uncharacterized membrane protein YccC
MAALLSLHADPGLLALKRAGRAAIVLPAVLAFADQVIQQPQSTIFASVGSFALLVLADFRGPPRGRLVAYLALSLVGAAFITLGTLCSQEPWLGGAVMAVVGFGVLFSSVINPYFAMAGWAPLLTFILPVTIPADPSAIPQRLEGWALACGVGIPAVMLLWPPRPRSELRDAATRACRALAGLVAAELDGDRTTISTRADAAIADVAALRRTFVSTPYRPTGATGSTEALTFLVDELDWLLSIAIPPADGPPFTSGRCGQENREVLRAVMASLQASAATLDGRAERPDLDRLERARDAVAEALVRSIEERPPEPDDAALVSSLEPSFRTRELAGAAREVGWNALRAAGLEAPEYDATRPGSALDVSRTFARGYGSVRSVLFRNSVRGAAALAVAVTIAQQASLQHSFWVVLGALSVLRSSALATGSSVLSALRGTAVGLLIGVGLVIAVGTNEAVLWILLPPAVLAAAYAPQVVSFAAGQAGFTVMLLILFNVIQPSNWTVGLVRIEDVAIGFAVSLGVGALFWPRGAASLVRRSLATSYARSADYVADAVQQLVHAGDATRARRQARAAADRLDDAFRQYLGERSGDRARLEELATLHAGATRVRLAAYSLSMLARPSAGSSGRERGADVLDGEVRRLHAWYVALGDAIVAAEPPPPPDDRDPELRLRILAYVRETVARDDEAGIRFAVGLLWATQHLDNLRRLEVELAGSAAPHVARDGDVTITPPARAFGLGTHEPRRAA